MLFGWRGRGSGIARSSRFQLVDRTRYKATMRTICPSQASSIDVKCSAAFSTKGRRIRPKNWSGTPASTTSSIRFTSNTARTVTKAIDAVIATAHSVRVNLALWTSAWWSRSLCSSCSRTESNMEWFVLALYQMYLERHEQSSWEIRSWGGTHMTNATMRRIEVVRLIPRISCFNFTSVKLWCPWGRVAGLAEDFSAE